MDVIQIGILGVAGALLAVQFKSGKTEYGIYISLALSLFIFFAVVSRLKILVDLLAQIGDYIQMDAAYTGTLLKMLGITYVAEFSSAICKDAGYQTIAVQIEIFAKTGHPGVKHACSYGASVSDPGFSGVRGCWCEEDWHEEKKNKTGSAKKTGPGAALYGGCSACRSFSTYSRRSSGRKPG